MAKKKLVDIPPGRVGIVDNHYARDPLVLLQNRGPMDIDGEIDKRRKASVEIRGNWYSDFSGKRPP